ncbi:MAG: nuclear transport factor 2 family protein [Saprospiraceae bacterium]|nr:nuclear transport factor 2 family protein [Saprospiraceae bacterium]
MDTPDLLIRQLYGCFQKKDYRGMAACYHPDATFRDPVFDLKNGKEVAAMWHFLCISGKDLEIEFSHVQADAQKGIASWEARYTFSRTGRKVHNRIRAQFEFSDNLIIRHRDDFSFWRWSRQAFGMAGLLLGWTPFFHRKVSGTAGAGLRKFIEQNPEYR